MRCFTENKYIFGKFYFDDEEKTRGTGRKFGETDFGQIHIMKSHFADEERMFFLVIPRL
jgi:hypothetical protein